jgi:hypothetical protein
MGNKVSNKTEYVSIMDSTKKNIDTEKNREEIYKQIVDNYKWSQEVSTYMLKLLKNPPKVVWDITDEDYISMKTEISTGLYHPYLKVISNKYKNHKNLFIQYFLLKHDNEIPILPDIFKNNKSMIIESLFGELGSKPEEIKDICQQYNQLGKYIKQHENYIPKKIDVLCQWSECYPYTNV